MFGYIYPHDVNSWKAKIWSVDQTEDKIDFKKVVEREYVIHIQHNKIDQHLPKERLAKEESKKKKRRKPYIRYERVHTLSAGHIEWYDTGFNNTMFFDCYNKYRGDFEWMNTFID